MTWLEFQAYVLPPHVNPIMRDAKEPDIVKIPM
jgi:hypothetical protein